MCVQKLQHVAIPRSPIDEKEIVVAPEPPAVSSRLKGPALADSDSEDEVVGRERDNAPFSINFSFSLEIYQYLSWILGAFIVGLSLIIAGLMSSPLIEQFQVGTVLGGVFVGMGTATAFMWGNKSGAHSTKMGRRAPKSLCHRMETIDDVDSPASTSVKSFHPLYETDVVLEADGTSAVEDATGYDKVMAEAFRRFRSECASPCLGDLGDDTCDSNGSPLWEFSRRKYDVDLFTKREDGNMFMKLEATVAAPVAVVMGYVMDKVCVFLFVFI